MDVARILPQIAKAPPIDFGGLKRETNLIHIDFTKGRFQVKLARSDREREEVFKLRYEIFYKEFSQQTTNGSIDQDAYDTHADLLVIKDLELDAIVGTYRVINSEQRSSFYSASEFDIDSFLDTPGKKVELSRACIHPDYRNGRVITLLWKGLHEYLSTSQARFLFGCSSVTTVSPSEINAMIDFLARKGATDLPYKISPCPSYDNRKALIADKNKGRPEEYDSRRLPPLLRAYLKLGAKISPVPAYDRFFSCYDFFTVFDRQQMNETYLEKFRNQ